MLIDCFFGSWRERYFLRFISSVFYVVIGLELQLALSPKEDSRIGRNIWKLRRRRSSSGREKSRRKKKGERDVLNKFEVRMMLPKYPLIFLIHLFLCRFLGLQFLMEIMKRMTIDFGVFVGSKFNMLVVILLIFFVQVFEARRVKFLLNFEFFLCRRIWVYKYLDFILSARLSLRSIQWGLTNQILYLFI